MCICMCTHATHYRYLGRDGVLTFSREREQWGLDRRLKERWMDGWIGR